MSDHMTSPEQIRRYTDVQEERIAALRAQVAGLASLLARIADRSSSRSESLERLVDEAAATVKALAEAGG